jgi:hypothetical protein
MAILVPKEDIYFPQIPTNKMPKITIPFRDEIPSEATKLASELHNQRISNLSIEIPSTVVLKLAHIDEVFTVNGNELVFCSLEARNHCAAINSFRKLADLENLADGKTIFEEAHQLWVNEIGHVDFASGRFLGLISKNVNVLQAGVTVIKNSTASDVFGVLRNIGNALPFLPDFKLTDLIDLAEVQHSKTLGDMAAGMFFNQVSQYLKEHPQRAIELYGLVREKLSVSNSNLYGTALLGLSDAGHIQKATEFAIADIESGNDELVAVALWVIGRLAPLWEIDSDLKTRVQKILTEMTTHGDVKVSRQAYQALANAAASQPELIIELLAHARPDNQAVLLILGNFVFFNFGKIIDHPRFNEILCALTALDFKSTHDFDYALFKLIETARFDSLVSDCLTQWVLKNYVYRTSDDKLSSCFPQTLSEIANKPLLHEFLTRWLVSDELILGRAYSDLVGYLWVHEVREPIFSIPIIDTLNTADLKYLVRRLLGWTFYEEPLISLTLSLLETNDARHRTFGWVYSLLVNELGKNYSHSTLEAIQEKLNTTSSADIEELLKAAETQIRSYTDAIDQLPIRYEMRPPVPTRIRHAVALKKAKEQREISERADEHSVFSKLFAKVQLKAGTGSFSIYQGHVSEINRLGSFSSFITLPAQYVVDPLNDEITKLGLRVAKRGDE